VPKRVPPSRSNPASPTPTPKPRPNRVLALLPPEERRAITPHLKPTELSTDQVLYGFGDPIAVVYFPETAVSSYTMTMEDGRTAEVGTVGNEGAVGLSAWMGTSDSPTTVICQIAGSSQAIALEALKQCAAQHPRLRELLLRAMQAFAIQTMHSAACNGLHSVDQRLARWLLMTHDRVQHDAMPLTQQFLAYMLGVYRPAVTVVARTFQAAGLIQYERGSITIVDRPGLEATACECYQLGKSATDALVPPVNGNLST
jgi:CRP-like cAMP-binding protein